jgi:hypothetical protein
MQGASFSAPETGRDSALSVHNPANGVPTQVDAALFQAAAYDLHELVGQYGDEQVPIGESLFLRKLFWASLPNKRQKLRDR